MMGLEGEYRLYPTPPLPEGDRVLSELVQKVREGEIQGLNVTIPHKRSVIPHLDGLTQSAAEIGAVNTIFNFERKAVGDNSDAQGFLFDLESATGFEPPMDVETEGSKPAGCALVLGAGGAARAVVYALWQAGWRVIVAARRVDQAQALVSSYLGLDHDPQPESLSAVALEPHSLKIILPKIESYPARILVNATSAGMIPDTATNPWPEGASLPEGVFVYDLVYKPVETALMKAARQAGLPATNGLGMLVEQAALALERWTGKPVPRQAMWAELGEVLKRGVEVSAELIMGKNAGDEGRPADLPLRDEKGMKEGEAG
jgi:shikimate dehydrogenase